MNVNEFGGSTLSKIKIFLALILMVFLSHAISLGFEKFKGVAVTRYLDSNADFVQGFVKDGKLKITPLKNLEEKEASHLIVVAAVVRRIQAFCTALDVLSQVLLCMLSTYFFINVRKANKP